MPARTPRHGTAARPRRARLMSRPQAEAFLRALAAANPKPETELLYSDPFTLLVAVVLSAQTTDAAVNRCTPALFAAAPTPERMAALGPEGIAPFIRTIGLWQAKARNVAALAREIVEKHGGRVPDTREALEALPGVGRKTANVVLGTAFGIASGVVVDTHVTRIAQRLELTREKTPEKIEQDLMRILPRERWILFSHQVIHFGRDICKARKPECGRCPLETVCRAPDKNVP